MVFGAIRVVLCSVVLLLYVVLVNGLCIVFYPIPPLYRTTSSLFTTVLVRLGLLFSGLYWISVSLTPRKRGRAGKDALTESWDPRAGDLIVSNWVSYFEILWLAFRFNPVFVLPIAEPPALDEENPKPTTRATGRRTGTGSANIALSTTSSRSASRTTIEGFVEVSLLKVLSSTGRLPPFGLDASKVRSLEDIRRHARAPVVVFPECTTSNGRALLKFANIWGEKGVKVPVKEYRVFLMCVRYDPPTTNSPTLSLSLPPQSSILPHPFSHLLTTSLTPSSHVSIRLLPLSESPSAATFVVSDVITGNGPESDIMREACEVLVAGLGKMKRMGMGWEDKAGLMEVYYGSKR